MNKLEMLTSYHLEDDLLQRAVTALYDGSSELRILEAGCGPSWPLKLDGVKYRLTGIDLDPEALAQRVNVTRDLHEAIVGDLREADFARRQFDVIYNAFVLEHVDNAPAVLENFARWLRPGGLLLLKLPDRDTVFGFLARVTPFWFHVAHHKYVLRRKNAGKPGFGPYPTHYNAVVSRSGIRRFCDSHGFTLSAERGLCTYVMEKRRLIQAVAMTVSALSFGVLPWTHNNLTFVLRKQ
jgi:SAM-dependent methyltransferase